MLERLYQLEKNVIELEKFKQKYDAIQISGDIQVQWALRYGLFESIQIVIDISCHLTSKYNLGNPKTYSECIELLEKENYLDKEIVGNLLGMVGLRNILVHEYVTVDLEKLYSLLCLINDFKKFAESIKDYI
jgi:uncharacterized protein YutE (UPF0331/DUF86 family)